MTYLSRESENSEDVSLKKQVIAYDICIDSSSIHTYLSLLAQMSLSLNSRPQCHQTLCEELWTILDSQVNQAADKLKSVIAPFVESSKTMAINISDQVTILMQNDHQIPDIKPPLKKITIMRIEQGRQARWRTASASLLEMVKEVAKLFSDLNM